MCAILRSTPVRSSGTGDEEGRRSARVDREHILELRAQALLADAGHVVARLAEARVVEPARQRAQRLGRLRRRLEVADLACVRRHKGSRAAVRFQEGVGRLRLAGQICEHDLAAPRDPLRGARRADAACEHGASESSRLRRSGKTKRKIKKLG